ncbi:hypothetical protein L1785_05610 [Antribacter sp. KLBMP9083]|uniref:Gram-positive cocci surface proteins LPxTG domain-containing protein n=1 Tax=Antribacter soli TaxID=2910976 RepID=A0AA41U6H4_9MICO|nr:hypothetical protein [Antribacter soli]MCF4120451.1 hypothetical protein [Antribacter soli]
MKKILAGGALMALALGGLVATATPASAHTPVAKADCTGLTVDLTAYSNGRNSVTVVVDGKELEATTFARSFHETYEWAGHGIDPASVKSWSVAIDATDGNQFDRTLRGGPLEDCTPTTTPVSPAAPTVNCDITSVDEIAKPEDTESITYTKDAAGILATLSRGFAWGDLGPYTQQSTTTATYPAAALAELLEAQECETEPTPTPTPTPTEAAPTPVTTPTPTPTPSAEPTPSPSVTPTPSASASPAPVAGTPPILASTGAQVGGAILFALLLVAGGFGLVWARKRIHNNG